MMLALLYSAAAFAGAQRPRYPTKLSPEIRQRFNEANELYNGGNLDAADRAFAAFIADFEYNELTDEAKFKRGEIRFRRNRYGEALGYYRSAGDGIYNPKITPQVQLKGGLALYELKRYGEAIDIISGIRRQDASPALLARADSLGMLAARDAGWEGKRTARFALFLLDDYIDLGPYRDELRGKPHIVSYENVKKFVDHWVNDPSITQEDIDALPRESYAKKPSGGYVLYKEALVQQRYGNMKVANRLLKKFVHAYPKNEYHDRAKALLAETSVRTGAVGFKVGVILPLSGRYRVYGESVLHGIECALGIYKPCEGPGTGIQIVVKDSRGSPASAVEAVKDLAEQDVQAIIGPLLSATVAPAATESQRLGIPMISVSQRSGVASIGDFIFRNSVTSKSQVNSLVSYSARKKGIKRYFIFYPLNKKGEEFKRLFSDAVHSAGGKITASKGYYPKAQDLTGQIRDMRFQANQIDLTGAPSKNYEAIFLPGSPWAAAYIAPMLAMMGMENVRLLGTMRWNDPNLIKRGGKYLEGALFVQAFDKAGNNPRVLAFVDQYTRAYGSEPTLLEGLGYDSMKMLLNASAQGAHKRETIRDVLVNFDGFDGVTGRITFDETGDAKRMLTVMEVRHGKAHSVQ
jgi:ABC-type branched-subunit amino acid transport system substrate-binding protein